MKIGYVCCLLLSLSFLVGCGAPNNSPNSQANQQQVKSTGTPPAKLDNNQAKTYNGWTTVKIEDDVEFQIPPTLELRANEFQKMLNDNTLEIANELYKFTNKNLVQQIVAQTKGTNELDPTAIEHFVTVKFRIERFSNTLPKWGEDLKFTSKSLKDHDQEIIEQICTYYKSIPEFKSFDAYIIKPSKILEINGTKCTYGQMGMKWEGQEELVIDSYLFFNGDRTYNFSITVKASDYGYWTTKDNDLRNIVNTFKPCK
ncbi:MAG: hypothetical protein K5982_00020 [Selenomonadaceae bacterium]|nr:hypothetical protein [Selenomonadaceae bacterium]